MEDVADFDADEVFAGFTKLNDILVLLFSFFARANPSGLTSLLALSFKGGLVVSAVLLSHPLTPRILDVVIILLATSMSRLP